MMWAHPGFFGFGFGHFAGMPGMFFGLVLVVVLVMLATRGGHHPAAYGHGIDTAYEAARLRYAKGEISKEQFDEIRRTLGR